jgi:hypothetical protein
MTCIEIDGITPTAEQLWTTVSAYGHFTAIQVRDGKARGVPLHLRRLRAANRDAFGAGLDGERVRALIRHALGETRDASVRVYVFEATAEPATMITVKAPGEIGTPQRLRSGAVPATGRAHQARRHGAGTPPATGAAQRVRRRGAGWVPTARVRTPPIAGGGWPEPRSARANAAVGSATA